MSWRHFVDSDGKRPGHYVFKRRTENAQTFRKLGKSLAGPDLLNRLYKILGEKNVKVVQKVIEKKGKVY